MTGAFGTHPRLALRHVPRPRAWADAPDWLALLEGANSSLAARSQVPHSQRSAARPAPTPPVPSRDDQAPVNPGLAGSLNVIQFFTRPPNASNATAA